MRFCKVCCFKFVKNVKNFGVFGRTVAIFLIFEIEFHSTPIHGCWGGEKEMGDISPPHHPLTTPPPFITIGTQLINNHYTTRTGKLFYNCNIIHHQTYIAHNYFRDVGNKSICETFFILRNLVSSCLLCLHVRLSLRTKR